MHVSMKRVATRPACNRGMAHVRKRMRLVSAQCDAYAPVSSHTCGDQTFVAPAHPVPCTICGLLVGGCAMVRAAEVRHNQTLIRLLA